MTESYLRIDPSGEIRWIQLDRVPYGSDDVSGPSVEQICKAIGCHFVEAVDIMVPGAVILFDGFGKIKRPPEQRNEIASRLCAGTPCGDDIAGPVIVCYMRRTEPCDEYGFFPLSYFQLASLSSLLGVDIFALSK